MALLQFNIENQLMAEAAEKQNLAAGRSFEGWPTYQRRRALRDMYFDKNIRGSVSDQAIKKLYNEKIAEIEREFEVRVQNILVPTEAEAEKVAERLKNGEDFIALAKEVSKDPSSASGGLPFIPLGDLIAPVEDAVSTLKVGQSRNPFKLNLAGTSLSSRKNANSHRPRGTPSEISSRNRSSGRSCRD